MNVCSMAGQAPKNRIVSKVKEFEFMPLFWMLFYLSYKCTRRCKGCYTANQGKINNEMSDKMFEDLLEFVPKVYDMSNIRVFLLVFLGGEPLLRTDRIKKILDKANKGKIVMGGCIYTNSDLIDSVNWNDLEQVTVWNTNITDISLKEFDRRANIIKKNSNASNISITSVMDDYNMTGNRLEDFTRYACEKNYRLRFYRNIYEGTNIEYKKQLIKKMHSIFDVIEDYKSKGYDMSMNFLQDILVPLNWEKYDIKTPYFCGKNVMSIRPDGSIGACLRDHVRTHSSIYSETPLQDIKQNCFEWSYKRTDAPDECKICPVREVCQSGCPNDKMISYGTHSGKNPFCEVYKETIPRLMELSKK